MRSKRSFPGRRRAVAGFTVIELVVIVTILAVLSGILIPVIGSEIEDARHVRAETDLQVLADAFGAYRKNTGFWPHDYNLAPAAIGNAVVELKQFECLYENVHQHPHWHGPYLVQGFAAGGGPPHVAGDQPGQGLQDPWGRPFRVRFDSGTVGETGDPGVTLFSLGQNGVLETSDENLAQGVANGDDVVILVPHRN